jgi:hypothetical protein
MQYNLVQISESLLHLQSLLHGDTFCTGSRLQPVIVLGPSRFTCFQLFVEADKDLSEDKVENDADDEAGQDDTVADPVRFAELLVPDVTECAVYCQPPSLVTELRTYLPAMLPNCDTALSKAMAL